MLSNDDDDTVGYKKPPKKFQFKPGQSGNRKGRPRKEPSVASSETFVEILERVAKEEIEVQGKSMTLDEILIRTLMRKAASGNIQAAKHLHTLRKEVGLSKDQAHPGVLVVPGQVPLHEWSLSAAIQQAPHRGASDEEIEALKAQFEKECGDKYKKRKD